MRATDKQGIGFGLTDHKLLKTDRAAESPLHPALTISLLRFLSQDRNPVAAALVTAGEQTNLTLGPDRFAHSVRRGRLWFRMPVRGNPPIWYRSMEMHQAKYFIAVCQTLNFTRAAKQCGITQPALTRAIQRLEHELGGQLFRRERGRTHVTNLGRIVRPHFEQLFESCAAIKIDSRAFLSLEKADATLGIMFTIGAGPLVGFLTDFRTAHPGITITLREGIPAALIELLLNGEIDVAVLASPGPLDRRLNARFLYRERLSVAFPSSHRFADQRTVSVSDLEGENYLARMNCETERRLAAICKAHNVTIYEICRSEREDWMQLLVASGAGICFLPEYSAVIPDLRILPLGNSELMRDVSTVTVAGRRFSPPMRKLIQAINRHAWLPIK